MISFSYVQDKLTVNVSVPSAQVPYLLVRWAPFTLSGRKKSHDRFLFLGLANFTGDKHSNKLGSSPYKGRQNNWTQPYEFRFLILKY